MARRKKIRDPNQLELFSLDPAECLAGVPAAAPAPAAPTAPAVPAHPEKPDALSAASRPAPAPEASQQAVREDVPAAPASLSAASSPILRLLALSREVASAVGQDNMRRLAREIGYKPQSDEVDAPRFAGYLLAALGAEEGEEYLRLALFRMVPDRRRDQPVSAGQP